MFLKYLSSFLVCYTIISGPVYCALDQQSDPLLEDEDKKTVTMKLQKVRIKSFIKIGDQLLRQADKENFTGAEIAKRYKALANLYRDVILASNLIPSGTLNVFDVEMLTSKDLKALRRFYNRINQRIKDETKKNK